MSESELEAGIKEHMKDYSFKAQYLGIIDWNGHPAYEWRVTISSREREFGTLYRAGMGHKSNLGHPLVPKLSDVLSCLLLDASCVEGESFEGWAENFGHSTDSRKALESYLSCQNTAMNLRKLLGQGLLNTLSELEH